MVQSFEKINRKILTEFKLLELSEMKTEKLIAKKKKNGIEKHLQHVELKKEKLQESNTEKKKKIRRSMKKILSRKKCLEEGCKMKIQEMKLQMKSEEWEDEKTEKITNEARVNAKLPKNLIVRLWTGSISGTDLRVRLARLMLVL